MEYCTHSDKNYVAKGIAMCQSIIQHDTEATIYYLCLDIETFIAVNKLNLSKENTSCWAVVPIFINSLESSDPQLIQIKNCKPSNYGTAYSQYCWALTPYLVWYLLNNTISGTKPKELLYCDADLYFYKNPKTIFYACRDSAAGIHTHRFSSYDPEKNDVGEFNVGCVYFKNNEKGREISQFWKECMFNTQNQYAEKYGTCGDQKYLDLFIPLFGKENIAVFDRDTNPVIYHGAPWNYSNYEHKQGEIFHNNEKIELTFNHFSHFNTNFDGNWKSSNNGEWAPENINQTIFNFYEEYSNKVYQANNLIK